MALVAWRRAFAGRSPTWLRDRDVWDAISVSLFVLLLFFGADLLFKYAQVRPLTATNLMVALFAVGFIIVGVGSVVVRGLAARTFGGGMEFDTFLSQMELVWLGTIMAVGAAAVVAIQMLVQVGGSRFMSPVMLTLLSVMPPQDGAAFLFCSSVMEEKLIRLLVQGTLDDVMDRVFVAAPWLLRRGTSVLFTAFASTAYHFYVYGSTQLLLVEVFFSMFVISWVYELSGRRLSAVDGLHLIHNLAKYAGYFVGAVR